MESENLDTRGLTDAMKCPFLKTHCDPSCAFYNREQDTDVENKLGGLRIPQWSPTACALAAAARKLAG